MSDSEDNQSLIDQIQALESALEKKSQIGQYAKSSDLQPKQESFKAEDDDENDDDIDEEHSDEDEDLAQDDPYNTYSCNDLQDLLELNRNILESIQKTQERMTVLLEECQGKQRTVEKLISQQSSSWQTYKIVNHNAGMPYFKDRNSYCPRRNEDAEMKMKNGELRLAELQRILKWNQIDKNNLLKAIQQEVRLNLLRNDDSEKTLDSFVKKTSHLPMDVKKAIGPLGATKFDWMKIANSISDNRHTAEECENMWNLYLHPDINKKGWSEKEEKDLDRIAEECGFEDWIKIAKLLNTNRTGYLCFLHYNTKNWKNLMKGQCWSRDDDEILTHLVSKTRMGDYVPWGYIASCMNNFTKQQIYFRWTYSLAPHLKKGRFSVEEDKKLMEAVAKYGENFGKISVLVMNNRTNIQLKEHYQTLVTKNTQIKKAWSLEEDEKLMQLKKKHGSNWAKISNELTSVTRVQARHRYAAITRLLQKGVSLANITREEFLEDPTKTHTILTYNNKSPWARENKEIHVKHMKVDDQLVSFFKRDAKIKKMENSLGKSYDSDKLKEDTKKLFHVLQKLNANLNVPNDIDDNLELSEVEQELAESLLNYREDHIADVSEKVETLRVKMFGPCEHVPENERFIPPLPFNFRVPRPKKTNSQGINFSLNTNEYHMEEIIMEFEPNEYVEEYLGEETVNQFRKLKKIMCMDCSNITRDKFYYLRCKPFSKSVFCFEPVEDIVIEENNTTSVTSKLKYDWHVNKMIPAGFINTNEEKQITDEIPISVIEPNKTTLKAYQELLLISRRFPSDAGQSGNQLLTNRGSDSLSLFKRRYEQLFHVPTGLSRIIPPDVVDESAFLPALEKYQKKTSQNKSNKRMKKCI